MPTPENHLSRLQAISPGFKVFWNRPENLSRKIDGSFTPCGLWSEYGAYLEKKMDEPAREGNPDADRLSSKELAQLAEFLEGILSNSESDEERNFSLAVKTCFLENLIHKPLLQEMQPYLGQEVFSFIGAWDREPRGPLE